MPHYKQREPIVLAAVKELADEVPELDLHYNVTTYWRAMYDFYNNLARIAYDHGTHSNSTVMHPQKPDWVLGEYVVPEPKKIAA